MTRSAQFDDASLRRYLAGAAAPADAQAIETATARDPDLAERLRALDPLAAHLAPAAAALLKAAPADRLAAALDRMVTERRRARRQRLAAFGAAGALAAGIAAVALLSLWPLPQPGGTLETAATADPAAMPWSQAVASYVRLMSADTFRATPMTAGQLSTSLQAAAAATGTDLTALVAQLPDLALARADILTLNGRPLAQLAFLDREGRVIAVCVLARASAPPSPAPRREGQAMGLRFVLWDAGRDGRLVIGDAPAQVLSDIARRIGAPA
jgi:anti-sigma factor RsiW